MISTKYFDEMYTMVPLFVRADLSNASLETTLSLLEFSFDKEYTLHTSSRNIKFISNITQGLGRIAVELDESLKSSWYVSDSTSKKLIYCRIEY